MVTVPHFISLIREHLPLRIATASLHQGILMISGDNWSFATESAWRVASSVGFEFGSGSDPSDAQVAVLVGQSVIGAEPFGAANLDPCFTLSSGYVLESFSATDFEPWHLRLPGDVFIIADGTPA